MAVLKHIPVKNGDYQAAIDYLMYKHDELSGKMVLGDDGSPVPREDFLMDGINCEPFSYPLAARTVNDIYGKNRLPGDVKAHHYILSFDPRDSEAGLTMDEAHSMAVRYAREWFGGHVGVVFTHPEGHNGAGNVYAHIVFCSVRGADEPVRGWMTHESEWRAGGKHHATNKCHEELKRAVMDMCRARNLHQVDLLSPAKERVTDREYWAQRRMALKEAAIVSDAGDSLGKRDETNISEGARQSRSQTQKQQIRAAVRSASERATDFGSFAEILKLEYGIKASMSRGRIAYLHLERGCNITGSAIRASGRYLSNREAWRAYRAAPDRRAFYAAHKLELEACNDARRALAEIFPDGKAPSINELRETKARLERERDVLYERWCEERHRHREISTAKRNVDAVLGRSKNEMVTQRKDRISRWLE